MQYFIMPLNCRDKHYDFDMVVVKDKDWIKFAKSVLLARTDGVSSVSLIGFKVIIRDNIARFKLFWQDVAYHELEFRLDPFGRDSKNYSDLISEIWQNIMSDYYGHKGYDIALERKMNNYNI